MKLRVSATKVYELCFIVPATGVNVWVVMESPRRKGGGVRVVRIGHTLDTRGKRKGGFSDTINTSRDIHS